MIEATDLETNLLEFRQKSFQFDRLALVGEHEYALFRRTETETESQLRPQLVQLLVVAPREWIVYDPGLDLLRLARDGATLARRVPSPAIESGAEPSEFAEQGIDWHRESSAERAFVYAPRERAGELDSAAGREALGAG